MALGEFEYRIIPAQADEIAGQCARAIDREALVPPMALYLLNMGGIRGLQALGIVVWQDRKGRKSLDVNKFYDQTNQREVGSPAAATANLIKVVDIDFQERIKRGSLRGFSTHIVLGNIDTFGGDVKLFISGWEDQIREDPWRANRDYARDRLFSIVATPGNL